MSTEDRELNEKTFSQEEVDKVVQARVAKEKNKVDKALDERIKKLESTITALSEKASQVDTLATKLTETETKLTELETEKQKQSFQESLKIQGIRADRVKSFAKLLGDDTSEESIEKLKKEYPEWLVESNETSEDEQQTPPQQKGRILVGSGANLDKPTKDVTKLSYQELLEIKRLDPEAYKNLFKK